MPENSYGEESLSAELIDRALLLTIRRPEAGNSIDSALSRAIARAFARAEQDDRVGVIVITGAGERVFCAGADLKELASGGDHHAGMAGEWGLGGTRRLTSKPLIAAVNGVAAGGGFEIALAADIIIAAEGASFMLPEVRIGIIAGAGGAMRLPRQLPEKIAMELLLTGEPLSAERAERFGLVNGVVSIDRLRETALAFAARIAANAPLALAATKRLARSIVPSDGLPSHEDWETNSLLLQDMLASADAAEGRAAFFEKRDPVWRSR